MANNIKGLIVEIGGDTTKLGDALENINKRSRSLSSELGEINRMLRFDPSNTELLAQKQKVLADAVTNTREKLDTLKEAERQVQQQFERGEVSAEQVRALQREIIATEKKLSSYENAAKETADAIARVGKESDDAADGLSDVAENAKKAEKESDDLGNTADDVLATGLQAAAAAATAAVAAIVGCVEATHEYRTEMGKLETAFTTQNHSIEAARNTYEELQSILGETDQAVEASNMLAQLADDEDELAELTEALTGVYATFGASLPIEGLAEAALESRNVAKVTGSFADAINWASTTNEDWNDILGDNKKALKAFNGAVEEGEAIEDAYTTALEACSDEQERQELIIKTLTKLYSGAGQAYKQTNADVIAANKANEQWTATMARLGENLAPVMTDIKLFGAEMLSSMEAPLQSVATFIQSTLLPALRSMGAWVQTNGPVIKATVVGLTAALATYKVATIAAEVAQNGLKSTIMATTVAQKALSLAQAATPWGLVAVGAAAVVTGLIAYGTQMELAKNQVDALTAEERELMAAADETAQKLRDQRAATEEVAGGITSQMAHVTSLANELQTLADNSGKVKASDEARAQFILNELNEALGTEYTMTDGVVQKYAELKKNIDEVIVAKTANALLEAHNADYIAAIQAEEQAMQNLVLAEKDYQAQLLVTQEAEQIAADARAALNEKVANSKSEADLRALRSEAIRVSGLEGKAAQEKAILDKKEKKYDEVAKTYGENANVIMSYEEAQQAVLEGNSDRAVDILKKKAGAYEDYADEVDEATANAIDALFKEAVDAGVAAARTKKNFEAGVKGYTKEMVQEAEKSYKDAMDAYATARMDAEGVGADIGDGMASGIESKRTSLLSKVRNIVSAIISAARDEADSHSPSRKMIDVFEDIGEGGVVGLEHKTKPLLDTAREQVNALMSTYKDSNVDANAAAYTATQAQASHRNSSYAQSFADGTAGKLDKILAAIERGQILTIDGDTLVGATADRYDATLGQRRALAVRGAL